MRVAVTGATGNVGTSVLGVLSADDEVSEVIGISRRASEVTLPKVRWVSADVAADDLVPVFQGVDAVIHLAWDIQPSHDADALRRTNVIGSRRVFEAAAEAGASILVHASSVGTYSPAPKDKVLDESWANDGIRTSEYSRDKAEVEHFLDRFERDHPEMRCVRLRPSLIFKREAAANMRRLFLGRFVPTSALRWGVPVIPNVPGLVFQAMHTSDVARAFQAALKRDVRGAFNLASDPVLDPPTMAKALGARLVPVPAKVLRTGTDLAWRARLLSADPGWVDIALNVPIMDYQRARTELGWEPRISATDALVEMVHALRDDAGFPTPRLQGTTVTTGTTVETLSRTVRQAAQQVRAKLGR